MLMIPLKEPCLFQHEIMLSHCISSSHFLIFVGFNGKSLIDQSIRAWIIEPEFFILSLLGQMQVNSLSPSSTHISFIVRVSFSKIKNIILCYLFSFFFYLVKNKLKNDNIPTSVLCFKVLYMCHFYV